MRVTYAREQKVKKRLEELGINSFLPMRYELTQTRVGRKYTLVPAIHNLIFIRDCQRHITLLKTTDRTLNSLRYIITRTNPRSRQGGRILTVPEFQMENFMRVASVTDDRVMFLDHPDQARVGKRVRVTEGYFAGVEGVIRRIQKNKRVVVSIEGCASVAITYLPNSILMLLDE